MCIRFSTIHGFRHSLLGFRACQDRGLHRLFKEMPACAGLDRPRLSLPLNRFGEEWLNRGWIQTSRTWEGGRLQTEPRGAGVSLVQGTPGRACEAHGPSLPPTVPSDLINKPLWLNSGNWAARPPGLRTPASGSCCHSLIIIYSLFIIIIYQVLH